MLQDRKLKHMELIFAVLMLLWDHAATRLHGVAVA
jgi:hypothetical protein